VVSTELRRTSAQQFATASHALHREIPGDRVATRMPAETGGAAEGVFADMPRRVVDVLVSGTALILLSPLIALVAVLVKLDSRGPVLFKQVRIGRNRRRSSTDCNLQERRRANDFGKPFILYKFRTMHHDAAEKFPELYRYAHSPEELRTLPIKILVGKKGDVKDLQNDPSQMRAFLNSDPRVTRVGRWLRRTSLDELPNLINVLKGDMHLVGPRPDIACNIAYYRPDELRILEVKPGITGIAQVQGRGLLTFEQTNVCDLDYVRNRSLRLDLKILLQTVPAILKREGAY
jgi:lipopolysaccharide/colanic/teichoic acid biosynthesis glycosyltransferase